MPRATAKPKVPMLERAQGIAEATPRDAIAALLKQFLPARPVATRPALRSYDDPSYQRDLKEAIREEAKLARQPRAFRFGSRTRRAADQRYEWIGYDTSRPGTFRRYMLTEIIKAHSSTRAARAAHEASGQHADQSINFSWAAKEGYIRFL